MSLETSPGKDLAFHLENKLPQIDRQWDVVILQGYSTLDAQNPGDPTRHIAAAKSLRAIFAVANPKVSVRLVSTWSRADLTYKSKSRWYRKGIAAMAEDLSAANRQALMAAPQIGRTVEVGAAWNRAMRTGLADPNPYDGVAFGKANLWTYDQYHASAEGSYLKALMVFGAVTGVDPRSLGARERAAQELGLDPRIAAGLRNVAAAELGFGINAVQ